jgi:hypothetical protein
MIIEFGVTILSYLLLFIPGVLLSYILFPKTDIIERSAYSVAMAYSIKIIFTFFISLFAVSSAFLAGAIWIAIILIILLIFFFTKNPKKTNFNKHIIYLLILGFLGFVFRIWFRSPIKYYRNCYEYATKFVKGIVPDLGFYTGMAQNHSYYVLGKTNDFSTFINTALSNQFFQVFIWCFIYLCFLYILFKKFNKNDHIFWAIALFSLGPIEIFTNAQPVMLLSYASVFSLLILLKNNSWNFFAFLILLSVSLAMCYYTATMVIILISLGFITSLAIKLFFKKPKNIKNLLFNRTLIMYLFIFLLSLSLLLLITKMQKFTVNMIKDTSNIQYSFNVNSDNQTNYNQPETNTSNEAVIPGGLNPYKDPVFMGFSAMGWQSILFILCGFSFAIYIAHKIIKKDLSDDDKNLLICTLPIALLSLGFFYMGYPARAFSYVSFFSILAININKKYYKIFFISAIIFILITCFLVAKDKRSAYEGSLGEINGALAIKDSFSGIIFTDECFANQLVLNDYYKVTGADDKDPIINTLFYQNNKDIFFKTISTMNKSGIPYIATTERMRNKYILMTNYQQKPITSSYLYDTYLQKVYDNNDVKVYSTNINTPK